MLYSVALGINDVQLYMNLCSCTILFVVLLAPENSSRALPLQKEKCIFSLILGQAGQVRARFSVLSTSELGSVPQENFEVLKD